MKAVYLDSCDCHTPSLRHSFSIFEFKDEEKAKSVWCEWQEERLYFSIHVNGKHLLFVHEAE
jgi:hypothetical protein